MAEYGAWKPVVDKDAVVQARRQRAVYGRRPKAGDPKISDAMMIARPAPNTRMGAGLESDPSNKPLTPADVARRQMGTGDPMGLNVVPQVPEFDMGALEQDLGDKQAWTANAVGGSPGEITAGKQLAGRQLYTPDERADRMEAKGALTPAQRKTYYDSGQMRIEGGSPAVRTEGPTPRPPLAPASPGIMGKIESYFGVSPGLQQEMDARAATRPERGPMRGAPQSAYEVGQAVREGAAGVFAPAVEGVRTALQVPVAAGQDIVAGLQGRPIPVQPVGSRQASADVDSTGSVNPADAGQPEPTDRGEAAPEARTPELAQWSYSTDGGRLRGEIPGGSFEFTGESGQTAQRGQRPFGLGTTAAANANIRAGLPNRGGVSFIGGYRGPTSTAGMSDEEVRQFKAQRQADIQANVARTEAGTAANRELIEAIKDAQRARGERLQPGQSGVNIGRDSHTDEWNARMRRKSAADNAAREGRRAGLSGNALAKYVAASVGGGAVSGAAADGTVDLGDMIQFAQYERGLQNDARDAQQSDRRFALDLAKRDDSLRAETRQEAEARRKAERQQAEDFMAGAEPFMQQASERFDWMTSPAAYFQSASRLGTTPRQTLNILAGVQQEIGKMTDPEKPLFVLGEQPVTGADAVAILNGEKPSFGNPGKKFMAQARQQAAAAIQAAALQELAK